MAAPRILLDENVSPALAAALRARGHDAVHVEDVGLAGADDPVVFAFAVRELRAVLTQNVRDFVLLVREHAERGQSHHGLILTRRKSLRDMLSGVSRVLSSRTGESLRDAVVWLE